MAAHGVTGSVTTTQHTTMQSSGRGERKQASCLSGRITMAVPVLATLQQQQQQQLVKQLLCSSTVATLAAAVVAAPVVIVVSAVESVQ
jgi:hypothetical protein